MIQGEVAGIFIAPTAGAPMEEKSNVQALPGRGLQDDRYFHQKGTLFKNGITDPGKEVTLIESEALEAIAREDLILLQQGCSRRNIVTRGVALNHLINREFIVGAVRLKGIRLCEPCGHLEKLTVKGVRKALTHRGGLRAQILTEGAIHVGDKILSSEPARSAACA